MNTTQRIVFRNGYQFIFYDNEENDDVQTILDYMFYLYSTINFRAVDKLIFVGDSNMRRAVDNSPNNYNLHRYEFELLARGGQRAHHLRELYPRLVQYRYICIVLGGNDLNNTDPEVLINYYVDFIGHLPSNDYIVRVVQLFSRKDHDQDTVVDFNRKLKARLSQYFFPNRTVTRSSFKDEPIRERCHLKPECYHKFLKLMGQIANAMLFNAHNAPQ